MNKWMRRHLPQSPTKTFAPVLANSENVCTPHNHPGCQQPSLSSCPSSKLPDSHPSKSKSHVSQLTEPPSSPAGYHSHLWFQLLPPSAAHSARSLRSACPSVLSCKHTRRPSSGLCTWSPALPCTSSLQPVSLLPQSTSKH